MNQRLKILDIFVDLLTMEEVLQIAWQSINERNPMRIITANAEMLMQAQESLRLKESLKKSDLVVADGAGIVWAGKELGVTVPERVAGIDLANQLLRLAAEKNLKVFFFGAGIGVAKLAAENAVTKYSGLNIVGIRSGFFSEAEELEIVKEINDSQADLLFVALGAPKQELWLDKYGKELTPSLRMGVGGSFDVMSGQVSRAPMWMQKNSLEWLYRAFLQPSRWRRLLALPRFMLAVKKQKKMDNL
jgi:bacterial polymer biosynthesis proteins, WecB/TagA/CpsF family